MPKPPSLQALASSLGLSKTTVSVALRGRPGVSEELRARIIAKARQLGYEPNPVAAELMALVRSNRSANSGQTIAFINTIREDPTLMKRITTFRDFQEGALEQARHYGYTIDEFSIADFAVKSTGLDRILKARNIRGVLIGPRWFDEPEVKLDWSAFSCVLIGETSYGAGVCRICNHHPQSMELALTSLVQLGYKRIGIELVEAYESVRHFDFLAGIAPTEYRVGPSAKFLVQFRPRPQIPGIERISPAERTQFSRTYESVHVIPKLERWIRKDRLDALLTINGYEPSHLCRIKTADGRALGYARLDAEPDSGCAGINQHPRDIGRGAMDQLRALLHAGERGVATRPRIVLVEGEWVDGPSAPPRLP